MFRIKMAPVTTSRDLKCERWHRAEIITELASSDGDEKLVVVMSVLGFMKAIDGPQKLIRTRNCVFVTY
jgi:hypothetical protein